MLTIDVSAAVHARAGLGRYSERLAEALLAHASEEIALFYNQGPAGRLPASLAGARVRSVRLGYKPWRSLVLLGHLGRIPFDRLVPDATLFHSTEHLLLPLRGAPTVLTVHDLIFRLFPAYHKKLNYWYLNLAMPLFCRRATALIAVSEATRQDVATHYGVDPATIHVVYEAAADHFRPPPPADVDRVRRQYGLPDRYLLHLATVEPRKNLSRLVDALQILRRDEPGLRLLLAGSKGWLYDAFFARLEADGLTDVVRHLGWVPDEDLPAIIAAASLAVQPSLYEGFGLPILEHMACGQAVAASRASSHPEVGGDVAVYFDPKDVDEMAAVVGALLADSDEVAARRRLGPGWAARFSWDRAARETLAVYRQVLDRAAGPP